MRILHVIYKLDPRGGGPPRALAGLAPAQKRAGLDVCVVGAFRDGADMQLVNELRDSGIRVDLVGPTIGPVEWHPRMSAVVRAAVLRADVVHVHGIWTHISHCAAVAAREARVPYVVRPCGMLDPWSMRQKPLRKRAYLALRLRGDLEGAVALHFTSDAERELVRDLKLSATKVVASNGIDLAEFGVLPRYGAFREKYLGEVSGLVVTFLSRVHPKKGLDILVPAFSRMRRPGVRLVIAGPDPVGYSADVRRLAAVSGVQERVTFTGMLRGRERIEALVDSDLFVLPSYQENFGIAVVEALASGTPVVISDQVNIWREIRDAKVGDVAPTSVDAFSAVLKRWIVDDDLRCAAQRRARGFVWARYNWDDIAVRWIEHYAGFVARGA